MFAILLPYIIKFVASIALAIIIIVRRRQFMRFVHRLTHPPYGHRKESDRSFF